MNGRRKDEWVLRPAGDPVPGRMKLFCFPCAGGGASMYFSWAEMLGQHIELVAVQLPGREWRISEDVLEDLHELADVVFAGIREELVAPYAFLGTSLGALLAFEVARRVRAEGLPEPAHLFVCAAGAPQIPEPAPLFHLPDDEFVQEIKELGGLQDDVAASPELTALCLPIIKADCKANDTYDYREQPPLDVPISVYGGIEDLTVSDERLNAWAEQTVQECSVHMLPGTHLFVNTAADWLLRSVLGKLAV
ncbi:MAG: thioesterase II family protein [Gammaproteobacteria bacterium]